MIVKDTVFILGAGASQPYGFPTGEILANWVCTKLREQDPNSEFKTALRSDFGVTDPRGFHSFVEAYGESGCTSLDAFVEPNGNRRFLPLVKAAILAALMEYEHPTRLFPDRPDHRNQKTKQDPPRDWYRYLFQVMRTADDATFLENRVKIITFNFDRSFEYQLFLMLRAAYGLSDADAGKLCAAVPVLHIHGSLGEPSWLGEIREDSRDYAPTATAQQKGSLMAKIRIVHEEISADLLNRAHEWLLHAHTVCFLGFGYHEINLGRLRMNEKYSRATIWGTTKGFTAVERARTEKCFGNDGTSLRLNFDLEVREFLRTAAVLQTERG